MNALKERIRSLFNRYILRGQPCVVCGYVEGHGNYILDCGHALCDECLLSGEAIDHECTADDESMVEAKKPA